MASPFLALSQKGLRLWMRRGLTHQHVARQNNFGVLPRRRGPSSLCESRKKPSIPIQISQLSLACVILGMPEAKFIVFLCLENYKKMKENNYLLL